MIAETINTQVLFDSQFPDGLARTLQILSEVRQLHKNVSSTNNVERAIPTGQKTMTAKAILRQSRMTNPSDGMSRFTPICVTEIANTRLG